MKTYPPVAGRDIGWLTAAQMIEVDRMMIDDLHINLVQMMENAGSHVAALCVERYAPTRVTVLAGTGGNGGGGLTAARHLANRGVSVTVVLSHPADRLSAVAAHQLDILERMGVRSAPAPPPADVVIDALIGYQLQGAPEAASPSSSPRSAVSRPPWSRSTILPVSTSPTGPCRAPWSAPTPPSRWPCPSKACERRTTSAPSASPTSRFQNRCTPRWV